MMSKLFTVVALGFAICTLNAANGDPFVPLGSPVSRERLVSVVSAIESAASEASLPLPPNPTEILQQPIAPVVAAPLCPFCGQPMPIVGASSESIPISEASPMSMSGMEPSSS
ncbi:hypothetical protein EV182_006138 [Spiromyces aspiralis]|uniref:Uncharacterized protein n=1 Tax=Spiromyces aspiralis TaxID=68401 RepID=A0ACC1HCG5_9FUNG|nr:hypothetical protein EV182_006138 [Spiromyces aspiralis]